LGFLSFHQFLDEFTILVPNIIQANNTQNVPQVFMIMSLPNELYPNKLCR